MSRPNKYPDRFRRDALELVRTSGHPIAGVARSLNIAEGTLWNWVRAERDAAERDGDPLTRGASPSVTSSNVCARRTWGW